MGNAWTGAMTDVMHDARMGGTDDAQTGAMSDVMHDVQTGRTYNAQTNGTYDARTGATTDVLYDVLMIQFPPTMDENWLRNELLN